LAITQKGYLKAGYWFLILLDLAD